MSGNSLVLRRSTPPTFGTYQEYREHLRVDFWFSCAYCTITEIEARGIGFEIDHFEPKTPPDNSYTNLMWACEKCNNFKRKVFPTAVHQKLGRRYLRPDQDDLSKHYELRTVQEDGKEQILLGALTPEGTFTVKVLGLNRAFIKEVRLLRKQFAETSAEVMLGLRSLHQEALTRKSVTQRFEVLRYEKGLKELRADLEANLLSLIKEACRSSLLDPDKDHPAHLKERKEYLHQLDAIVAE